MLPYPFPTPQSCPICFVIGFINFCFILIVFLFATHTQHILPYFWAKDNLVYMFLYLASFTYQYILEVPLSPFIKVFFVLSHVGAGIFKGIFMT